MLPENAEPYTTYVTGVEVNGETNIIIEATKITECKRWELVLPESKTFESYLKQINILVTLRSLQTGNIITLDAMLNDEVFLIQ